MYIVRYNRLIHLNQYCKPFTNIYNYFLHEFTKKTDLSNYPKINKFNILRIDFFLPFPLAKHPGHTFLRWYFFWWLIWCVMLFCRMNPFHLKLALCKLYELMMALFSWCKAWRLYELLHFRTWCEPGEFIFDLPHLWLHQLMV